MAPPLTLVAGKNGVPGPEDENKGYVVKSQKLDKMDSVKDCIRVYEEALSGSGTLEVNLGPSKSVKPCVKSSIIDRSIRPKNLAIGFDEKENDEKSVNIKGKIGHCKPQNSPIVEDLENCTSKSEITISENATQRHLYVAKKNTLKSSVFEDDLIKKKLGTKMKQRKVKSAPGKPEKSEIFKMFEKLKKNKFCYCRNRRRALWRKHSILLEK